MTYHPLDRWTNKRVNQELESISPFLCNSTRTIGKGDISGRICPKYAVGSMIFTNKTSIPST